MGSMIVNADGSPFSYSTMVALSCTDIGMPAPVRPKKKSKSISLMLPDE